VEPTPKHKSLAVASGATPIGKAVRVPDEFLLKERSTSEYISSYTDNSTYTPIGKTK